MAETGGGVSAGAGEPVKVPDGLEREEAEYLVACLELYKRRLAALDSQMAEEAAGDEEIERLQIVQGVRSKVVVERFENTGQVSNYLGLAPRVYLFGDTVRYGRITKRGNGHVRVLLVQAARAAPGLRRRSAEGTV